MHDSKYIIYGLTDPNTSAIRYIGQSSQGLNRPKEHAKNSRSNAKCRNWVKSLRSRDLTYGITILEVLKDSSELNPAEIRWIKYGRDEGWDLTNMTDGGEGTLGHIKSKETRARLSAAATLRQSSPEVRERARLKALGHITTEETKIKISKKLAGRKLSAEHSENIGKSLKGRIFTDAHRLKLKLAASNRVGKKSPKGRILTESHKLNLRIAALKRYAKNNKNED